jgi:hypothetical protein
MSGYGIDRIGESEVSAWELGSRSCRKPVIMIMNLFALSTGFILSPGRVTRAFYRGCRSRNLYYFSGSLSVTDIDKLDLAELTATHLEIRERVRYKGLRTLEFGSYIVFSLIIHLIMLFLGKSMLIAEGVRNRLRRTGRTV